MLRSDVKFKNQIFSHEINKENTPEENCLI